MVGCLLGWAGAGPRTGLKEARRWEGEDLLPYILGGLLPTSPPPSLPPFLGDLAERASRSSLLSSSALCNLILKA